MKKKTLLFTFIFALLLRLCLVFSAYHGDLNNNISWATLAVDRGLNGFYESGNWPYSAPNQPPLTIITFAFLRKLWLLIENSSWWLNNNIKLFPSSFIWFWEQKGMILLIKLPSILADLGIGWLIYEYLSKHLKSKRKKEKLPLVLAAVWLFNPTLWYNSTIWGQTDSVVNLLGLIAIFALLNKNFIKSTLYLTLSFLFKGSLSVFIPMLLFIAIKQRYSFLTWFRAAIAGMFTTIFISIWFHPKWDIILWLINLYNKRILPGEIGYLTANAFNFWWLVNPGKVFDSTTYLGIPARIWGFIFMLSVYILMIWWLNRKINNKRVFLSLAITALASFVFMTRIHERYLYPFFPPATILLGFIPGFWLPYAILTVSHFLNLYHLFWSPNVPFLDNLYENLRFMVILSLINLTVFVYFLRQLRSSKI